MDQSFNDRERQFEAKFAHDQEILFKVRIHRDRLFAHWAADQLGDNGTPDYAEGLIAFAFKHQPEDIIAKVIRDLRDHGIAAIDTKVRKAFEQSADQARAEVMTA